ncbi:hypothetical protein BEP19_01915 [Ammoniphilus oxalaticus]|uniref:histidine kinase n=1 Tax=Ammoniphilus oxalaticus TaxID=66863 RepID=A0A419SNA3_9BACL|nr:HAMP domain-containing sensor histidine kinase [Ammoniphilus oxalaticus]RKD25722.1 hypothetical protein BEP19_01915 [Ammoniphilus oxalaticus]
MPIRLKLALWYSGVSFLIMSLFCSYLYLFFTHREVGQIDAHLMERAQEVRNSITFIDAYPFPMQRLVLPDIDVFASAEVFLQIVDRHGNPLSRSDTLGGHTLPISERALGQMVKRETYFETKRVHQTLLRIFYEPLYVKRELVGILQVAESLYSFQRAQATLKWLLAIGALTITAISAAVGWFLAGKALQPIHRIIDTTALIERTGALRQRIDYTGPPDEIGELSTQINQMMDKIENMYSELEEAYDAQRRFVADASHELRTPLTSIRGNMDYLRKLYLEQNVFSVEAADDIIEELERISRMVHDLLALARADAGYKVPIESLPARELATDWIELGQRLANGGTVAFARDSLEKLDGITIRGNRDFLRQVFLIILENAFKYTEQGSVCLSFQTRKADNQVSFTVTDSGIGIPAEDLPRLFDRFYRGTRARNYQGTGLGLSIAKWIIDRHAGTIEISSQAGQGATVIVTLPSG